MEQYNAIWSSAPPPRKQFDVNLINENRFDSITFPQCESKFIYIGDARAARADRKASSETALRSWVRRGMRTEERFIFNRSPQWVQLRGQRRIQSSAPRTAHYFALLVLQSFPRFSNHKAWFCETCNRTVSLDLWTFLLLFSAFLFVNKKKSLNRVWSLTVDLSNTWRFYCIRWLL